VTAADAPTVLVVDDETDVRDLVRLVLEVEGFRVVGEAADGVRAVERFDELRPDIVLLDNQMPGRTGLEVARELLVRRPEQLVVLFSAEVDGLTRRAADELGVAVCIRKADAADLPGVLRSVIT
jgi:CheY-like chemotaxis protein